jgi:hypothetical protein
VQTKFGAGAFDTVLWYWLRGAWVQKTPPGRRCDRSGSQPCAISSKICLALASEAWLPVRLWFWTFCSAIHSLSS